MFKVLVFQVARGTRGERGSCSLQGREGEDRPDDLCLPPALQVQDLGHRGVGVLRQEEDSRCEGSDYPLTEALCGLLCQHGRSSAGVTRLVIFAIISD